MTERIVLRAGALELALLPDVGGSIGHFDRITEGERQAIMRGTDEEAPHVLQTASFPLVPFCNRIRGGSFAFEGKTIRLTPNMLPDRSPLHGQGWLAPWTVLSCAEDKAELGYRHEPGEWPWAYEAYQRFELDADGFFTVLSCRNLSDGLMPCGLGLHPYFWCDAETIVDTEVDCVWTIDEDVLPVDKVPAQGRFDLRDRRICGQDLDNGFGGWGGRARIRWANGTEVTFTSSDAQYFQIYSPREGGIFVAEPVQHANAALNAPVEQWEELGIALLAPGEARELRARFDVHVPSPRS